MKTYLGLGSNLGDRKARLESAVQGLRERLNPKSLRLSALYETAALLPSDAPAEWDQAFLNAVVEVDTDLPPEHLLLETQSLERAAGRQDGPRWAPRPLDIDILYCDGYRLESSSLHLPHREMLKRSFVLDPLKDLSPQLAIGDGRVVDRARSLPGRSPLWMAILNVTPDSFSDGGEHATLMEGRLREWDENMIAIVDIGGESTRPGAAPITAVEEWNRVRPALELCRDLFKGRNFRPRISLDTRHFATAVNGVEWGADIINDVSGLADPRFADLAAASKCSYILMHSLSVPADPRQTLAPELDVVAEIKNWFAKKIELLCARGVALDKIIIDPGIGFGKSPEQSRELLRGIDALFTLGCRVLVGHSRKSFLAGRPAAERDPESVGLSLALAERGVDILRVHHPILHRRAFAGWSLARRST